MASIVGICNLANVRLGANPITSINDKVVSAIVYKSIWDDMRDAVLADFPWNFAIKRASLAQDLTPPLFGFTYSYTVPSDCLRMLGLCQGPDTAEDVGVYLSSSDIDPTLTYKMEQGHLLTNVSPAYVKYITRIENEGLFSSQFAAAMSARLAAEAAYKITGAAAMKQQMMVEYGLELIKAKQIDSQEDTPEVFESNPWIDSRV